MRIAICDDELQDLNRILCYCTDYDPSLHVDTFSGGAELLSAFQHSFYDLVFLDIEMAEPNGLVVGEDLVKRTPKPIIVFTTQSLNYAVRGYGIALRYLPKPVDYDTFSGVMRLAVEKILSQKISITYDGEQLIIPVNDISYFEVIRHQVIFHFENQTTLSVRGTLSEIKAQLSRSYFVQPHKSYCVNLDHIDRVSSQKIIMTNGDVIPIGRSMKDSFQNQLNLFIKGNNAL